MAKRLIRMETFKRETHMGLPRLLRTLEPASRIPTTGEVVVVAYLKGRPFAIMLTGD